MNNKRFTWFSFNHRTHGSGFWFSVSVSERLTTKPTNVFVLLTHNRCPKKVESKHSRELEELIVQIVREVDGRAWRQMQAAQYPPIDGRDGGDKRRYDRHTVHSALAASAEDLTSWRRQMRKEINSWTWWLRGKIRVAWAEGSRR